MLLNALFLFALPTYFSKHKMFFTASKIIVEFSLFVLGDFRARKLKEKSSEIGSVFFPSGKGL